MKLMKTKIIAVVLSIMPVTAYAMTDCTYTATLSGKRATIVVSGGEPVSYKWGSYTATNVRRQGDAITIDNATLANLRIGQTSSGKPAFQGDWRYQGSDRPTTFTCINQ